MKVTFLIPSLSGGGIENMTRDLVKSFANNNYEIDLITIYKSKEIQIVNKNINHIALNKTKILFASYDIYKYLKNSNTKIIFSFLHTTSAMLKLLRNFSVKKPVLFFSFNNNLSYQYANISTNKQKFKILDKIANFYLLNVNSDKIIFQSGSKDLARDLKTNWKFQNKINVINNPINLKKIDEEIKLKKNKEIISKIKKKFIIAIGRLTYQKNFDILIYAFSEIYKDINLKLIILGEGEEREKLEQIINSLNLSKHVSLVGYLESPYYLISRAEMFILSSRYEGFGNVLAEALACETNIISSDCDFGPSEILENGKWGKLFSVGDKKMLKKLILQNYHNPPNLELRQKAKEFDIENISKKYFKLVN